MNHALARALRAAGLNAVDVAAQLGVDPKTVDCWLGGRVPYPRNRAALIKLTGWTAAELWPELVRPDKRQPADEVRVAYAHRSSVPSDAWRRLFEGATRDIGVLAYSSLFLAEDGVILRLFREKARCGVRVRIALGDPGGKQIAQRGSDEGIDHVMTSRIHNALVLLKPLTEKPGIAVRLHDTILYNSIYRADDELLVNTHVYGCPGSQAPVLHLRQTREAGMFATYLDSFERVWSAATDI